MSNKFHIPLIGFAFFLSINRLHAGTLLTDSFSYPDGLITNEYAYWNPNDSKSIKSAIWEMTSGSFFAQGGTGWTGVPDDIGPNPQSTSGTNSAVFRLNTKRSDFGDVAVSLSVLNQGLTSTRSTPPADWDGLHIWLRYQTEYNLYYASINRRDNKVIIKKKIPGGPSNGGTYYELSSYRPHTVPYNVWQDVKATVKNESNGSVTIELYSGGTLLVKATDDGSVGGPPIRAPGKVGLRGDNANLKFDNFVVKDLIDTPDVPSAPTITSITAGDTTATVSWNNVSGATSYNLRYSRTQGVPEGSAIRVVGVTSPYTWGGLENDVRIYVVMTAVNATGESTRSQEVSVVPTKGEGELPPIPAPPPPSPVDPSPSKPRVYPIPWSANRHQGTPITFEQVADNSLVKIMSRSGEQVAAINAERGSAKWDLRDDSHTFVPSGIYIYFLTDERGHDRRGGLVIVK